MSRGADCPKVLAATHFHDIFATDLLDPHSSPVTFLHMEVLFASDKGRLFDAPSTTTTATADRSTTGDSEGDHVGLLNPQERITYLYR